jgi:peptidoglycan hydrolase-like protein with peptidoglycan-binding domain
MATEAAPRGGEWVRQLQDLLDRAGPYWNDTRNDEYGPAIQEAVRSFQRDHGLEPDGLARGSTWVALLEATDTEPRSIEIDWEKDYPEIYALATAADFDDYLRRVVELDPELFRDETE